MFFECAIVLAGMLLLFILLQCDKMKHKNVVKCVEKFKILQSQSCTSCKRPAK